MLNCQLIELWPILIFEKIVQRGNLFYSLLSSIRNTTKCCKYNTITIYICIRALRRIRIRGAAMALKRYSEYATANNSVFSLFLKMLMESAALILSDNEFRTIGADILKARC
jgi:hypothetical protein